MAGTTSSRRNTFLMIWSGELISLLGSKLSSFSIGFWVFQTTGSASLFAMVALAASLPAMFLGPVLGAIADRREPRRVMMSAEAGIAVGTGAALLLFANGAISIWHLYPLVAWNALCAMYRASGYEVATTLVVPKEQFGRAGGLATLGPAVVNIAAPVVVGASIGVIGVVGILTIDLLSSGAALMMLARTRIPHIDRSATAATLAGADRPRRLREQVAISWAFVSQRPGLRGLLFYGLAIYLSLCLLTVLLTPMLLATMTPAAAGRVLSLGGIGMLLGSIAVTLVGIPHRHIVGIVSPAVVFAMALVLIGVNRSTWGLAVGMFAVLAVFPLMRASLQALWRRKTPVSMQGSVYALRAVANRGVESASYIAAGPLIDKFLGPMMLPGGGLTESAGWLVGVGPGRGIALLFVLLGVFGLAASAVVWLSPRMRFIEDEMRDAMETGVAVTA